MSTLTYDRPRTNLIPLFLFLLFGAFAAIMLVSAHAYMTHGQAAMNAQDCFNGKGQTMQQVYLDPTTGRHMKFCFDRDSKTWFVGIFGSDGGNVTAYPRSFARCLTDVTEYAKRIGFTKLLGIMP